MTQPDPVEMKRADDRPLVMEGETHPDDDDAQARMDALRTRIETAAAGMPARPASQRPPTWYPAQNDHVVYLQERLRLWGFPTDGDPEGVFSSATEAAVRLFQSSRGLRPDAFVGPQTWGELEMAPPERKG